MPTKSVGIGYTHCMTELTDPRAKLLLGEAIRLLVQSGAAGAAITDFVQGYSEVLRVTLTEPPATVAADLKAQLKEALTEVLQELAPPSRRSDTGSRRKRVAVYVAGVKTSLSLRQELLTRAEEVTGSKKTLRQQIHDFANTQPVGHNNRSAWVEEQLQALILLAKVTGDTSTSH